MKRPLVVLAVGLGIVAVATFSRRNVIDVALLERAPIVGASVEVSSEGTPSVAPAGTTHVDDVSALAPTTATTERVEGALKSRLTVRTKVARRAAADVRVDIVKADSSDSPFGSRRTNARGRTAFDVPSETALVVLVYPAEGEQPVRRSVTSAPPAEAKTLVVDFSRVESAQSHLIRVLSKPSGRPIEGATVIARQGEDGGRRIGTRRTDADGTVRMPTGADVRYSAFAVGHSKRTVQGEADVIELPAHAVLRGRIDLPEPPRWHDRESTEGAHLAGHLELRIGRPAEEFPDWGQTSHVESIADVDLASDRAGPPGERAFVDSDGNWVLAGIPFPEEGPKRRTLTVYASTFETWRPITESIEVEPGDDLFVPDPFEAADATKLRLRYEAQDGAIEGTAVVLHSPENGLAVEARDEYDGTWSVSRLIDGRWDVRFGYDNDGEPAASLWHAGEAEHTVVVQGYVPLRGRIIASENDLRSGLWIEAASEQASASISCGRDGTFVIHGFRPDETVEVVVTRFDDLGEPGSEQDAVSALETGELLRTTLVVGTEDVTLEL
ncbi:MAG: hypothetical protein AAGI22_20250 [Planctomycetota bacterium]